MAGRAQPDWDFSKFFLVKDSLAAMLESASLLEEALREYTEMEALFLTTAAKPQPGNPEASGFGERIYIKEIHTAKSQSVHGKDLAAPVLLTMTYCIHIVSIKGRKEDVIEIGTDSVDKRVLLQAEPLQATI